jgi:hypothetical protein
VPVVCWLGFSVSFLRAHGPCQMNGQAEQADWVFNTSHERSVLSWDGQTVELGFMDLVQVDPGSDWNVQPVAAPSQLLVARQGRETIEH